MDDDDVVVYCLFLLWSQSWITRRGTMAIIDWRCVGLSSFLFILLICVLSESLVFLASQFNLVSFYPNECVTGRARRLDVVHSGFRSFLNGSGLTKFSSFWQWRNNTATDAGSLLPREHLVEISCSLFLSSFSFFPHYLCHVSLESLNQITYLWGLKC